MMTKWQKLEELNEWTGEVRVRYIAEVKTSDRKARAYLQVHEVGGKWYWSANIIVAHRPDLTKYAFDTLAATPQALPVAKMLASRRALRTVRAMEPLTRAA